MFFLKKNSLIYDSLLKKTYKLKKIRLAKFSISIIVNIFIYSYYISKISLLKKKNFKFINLINSKFNMLFSKKVPLLQKKKQKNRIFKQFKIPKNNEKYFKIKCLKYFRFFLNHIKMIDFFLRKCNSRFRRRFIIRSRKQYYKKLKEKDNKTKFRMKNSLRTLKARSTKSLYKKRWYVDFVKKVSLKKYRRYKHTYICFNHKKMPYSRKSLKSRMGKGKGTIKNWFLKYTSGKTILYLKRWHSRIAVSALRKMKHYIPGKTITILPYIKKMDTLNSESVFCI